MKRAIFYGALTLFIVSCSASASEEQSKAAKELCDCVGQNLTGDFDIDYSMCDLEMRENYPVETFSDEGWTVALEEECPDVASKLTDSED